MTVTPQQTDSHQSDAGQSTDNEPLPVKGDQFRCGQCGMEIRVIADFAGQRGQPTFVCCGKLLQPSGKSFLMESREAFLSQMQFGMQKTKENINWLRTKASQAKDASKDELSREAEVLSQQYEQLRESLGELGPPNFLVEVLVEIADLGSA